MALSVSRTLSFRPLSVSRNPTNDLGAPQNPQQSTNVQLQDGGSSPKLQPSVSPQPVQGGNVIQVQKAATQAEIAKAAEIQRAAVIAEVARQKELAKASGQAALNQKVANNQSAIKLKVSEITANPGLSVSRTASVKYSGVRHDYSGDSPDYYLERVKNDARDNAKRYVDEFKADPNTGGFGFRKLVDKLTFGSDARGISARRYAESRANQLADVQIKKYTGRIDQHNALVARLQADFERQRASLSPAELDALAKKYDATIAASVRDLNEIEAYTTGSLEGYGIKAEEKLASKVSKIASFVNNAVGKNTLAKNIFKYTLGSGSENWPSVISAPGRAVNFLGNVNTKDRTIYKTGGETTNRIESGKTAWQATFEQRQSNIKPVVDVPYSHDAALALFEADRKKRKYSAAFTPYYLAKNDLEREQALKEYWQGQNFGRRLNNSIKEAAADPINYVGEATKLFGAAKDSKYVGEIFETAKAGKYTGKAARGIERLGEVRDLFKSKVLDTKFVKRLGSEAKTPEELLQDAITTAREVQGNAQSRIFDRVNELNTKLAKGAKLDISVFDDFKDLTESEVKILQRMRDGKFSPRDRAILVGRANAATRDKLQNLAVKWTDFTEQMLKVDGVGATRFGRGKKLYSPDTTWVENLDAYNFKKFKKRKGEQDLRGFVQGAKDRYFKSNLDEFFANIQSKRAAGWRTERDALLRSYDQEIAGQRQNVEKAYRRVNSPINKIRRIVSKPTEFWKKSALKYRPAWTVNNVAYNLQAGVLSSGGRFGLEQAKMLNPGYLRKAYDEIPAAVREGLIGSSKRTGKLNKFYSDVENSSRVAAFRALKRKGLSDESALARVDKYFFNNTIKNYERPLKAVLPFYSFQKNLTKAAVTMPLDRPIAAKGYNLLDRYQKTSFDNDFNTTVPELKKLGYTDAEIEAFRKEQGKYYSGKLKVGGRYINTPFNPFSESGLGSAGVNPFLAAIGESADSADSFGRTLRGSKSSLWQRLISKFPQADLVFGKYKSWMIDHGFDRPTEKYIGKAGSDGFGLTKEKQGYDRNKPNYVPSMDPRNETTNDFIAMLGKPRDMVFDKQKFINAKRDQKLTSEYFSKSGDWSKLSFSEAEKQRTALFDKYGVTADDFYKGVLSKYDSDHTVKIKGLKDEAAKYVNKESIAKASKQKIVQHASKTGDWSEYKRRYGTKETLYKFDGKYFYTAETMAKYKEGIFWKKYADSSKEDRKKLLADNPEYNRRANWSAKDWQNWKKSERAKNVAKLNSWSRSAGFIKANADEATAMATSYKLVKEMRRRQKKLVYA